MKKIKFDYNKYFSARRMFLKVIYKKEVHVYHSKGDTSYETLKKYIGEVFKQLPEKYQLTYFDDEDEITLACQSDLETMLQISQKTVKVYITEVNESFYDQTQKVVLDDDMRVQPLEQQIQELRLESQEESDSVQSSEPLLQESQNKPEVEIEEDIKSVSKSDEPLQEKNDQPEIIEQEKPQEEQIHLSFDQSQIESSQISRITEADIEEKFKQLMPQFMEKVKKSLLEKSSISSKNQKIVHERITCDECGKNSIEGVRYKCSVCADFDLCQNCETTSSHSHPFLKIKHPKQTPYKIFAVIEDDHENSFEVNGHRVQLPQFPIVNQLFDAFGRSFQNCQRGFNFGSQQNHPQCPFKRNFEKKEEEKMEEKVFVEEPQKKTKVEEQKPVEKVEPKIESKSLGRIFQKPVVNPKAAEEAEKKTKERISQNAKYLFQILSDSVQEHQCYMFAKKYPTLSKEEILSVYFAEKY